MTFLKKISHGWLFACAFVVSSMSVSFPALAQETGGAALDAAAVTAHLDGPVQAAITAIGGSILVLAVAAMGFKWIKGMIFS